MVVVITEADGRVVVEGTGIAEGERRQNDIV